MHRPYCTPQLSYNTVVGQYKTSLESHVIQLLASLQEACTLHLTKFIEGLVHLRSILCILAILSSMSFVVYQYLLNLLKTIENIFLYTNKYITYIKYYVFYIRV